ncbi:MAG: type II toxin-antitoxin system VapC family toxin [Candidatus Limnocylindrales bacterium]
MSPALFLTEVANAQLRGQKAPARDAALRIESLAAAGIETADRGLRGLVEAIELADRHGLTVYNALYLQLALDVEGELATLDSRLRDAADAEGVTLVPNNG